MSRTRPRSQAFLLSLATLFVFALSGATLQAQDAGAQDASSGAQATLDATGWVEPPAEIADAVLAPRYLNVSLNNPSPNGMWFLHNVSDGPVTMDRFSRPFDELGGSSWSRRRTGIGACRSATWPGCR